MKENQTTLLYKKLRGHPKSMSHAYKGGGLTKKVIKCDLVGVGEFSNYFDLKHILAKLQDIFKVLFR